MAAAPNTAQLLKQLLGEAIAPVVTMLTDLQISVKAQAGALEALQTQLADITLAIETKTAAKRAVKVSDAVVAGEDGAASAGAAAAGAAAAPARKAKAGKADMTQEEALAHVPNNKRLWAIHCAKYDLHDFRKYCTPELIERACVVVFGRSKTNNSAKTFQNVPASEKFSAEWYKAAMAVVYDGGLTPAEQEHIGTQYSALSEKQKQLKQSAAEPLAPETVQDDLAL